MPDPGLLLALGLGAALALHGIEWGRVECWHPDQMAFQGQFKPNGLPPEPPHFLKPPFHTYFNYYLSWLPLKAVEVGLEKTLGAALDFGPIILLWSRVLTVFLFLGATVLVFKISHAFFGLAAARAGAVVLATSAGLVLQSHFLTADMPVLFWMLAAFFFCQRVALRGRPRDYALAGLLTGIATATKYNGLAVGIGIVAAHAVAVGARRWRALFLGKDLYLGLAMVPLGFLAGNPFAILAHERFVNDFWYNTITTPVYDGIVANQKSHWQFLMLFQDIIGLPALLLGAVAWTLALARLLSRRAPLPERQGVALLLVVFLPYFLKLGSFPRLEVRFAVPMASFALMLFGPLWSRLASRRAAAHVVVGVLVAYNSLSSYHVGKRFAEDPRMAAQEWVKVNVPSGRSIESSRYVPTWNRVPGVRVESIGMPPVSGRVKLFERVFRGDARVMEEVRRREPDADGRRWYTREGLLERRPDYVAVDSIYYERFLEGEVADLHPSMKQFFQELLDERYPYRIVFDRTSPSSPAWLYPREILFVDNRMTILARSME